MTLIPNFKWVQETAGYGVYSDFKPESIPL